MKDVHSEIKDYVPVVLGAVLFLFGFYLLAPLVHEAGHIAMLKYYNCGYVTNLDIVMLKSFYGKIYEACELTKVQQLLVYLGGVIFTFVGGFILMVIDIALTRKRRINLAILSAALAMAFFLNTSVYFFQDKGDIVYALQAVNIHMNFMPVIKLTGLAILGMMLLMLGISLYHDVQMILVEWEANRDEWDDEYVVEESLASWFIEKVNALKLRIIRTLKPRNRKSRAQRK